MATATTTLLVAVLVLVVMSTPPPTEAMSAMTVWSNDGCDGLERAIVRCGCSEFSYAGIDWNYGYRFQYDGQSVALYNSGGCQGVAHHRLAADAENCGAFGWKSIWIQC